MPGWISESTTDDAAIASRPEGRGVERVPRPARRARLSHGKSGPRRESDQLRHQLAGRLDTPVAPREPRDDPVAHRVRSVLAARAQAPSRALRLCVRDAALQHLARSISLLRLALAGIRHW